MPPSSSSSSSIALAESNMPTNEELILGSPNSQKYDKSSKGDFEGLSGLTCSINHQAELTHMDNNNKKNALTGDVWGAGLDGTFPLNPAEEDISISIDDINQKVALEEEQKRQISEANTNKGNEGSKIPILKVSYLDPSSSFMSIHMNTGKIDTNCTCSKFKAVLFYQLLFISACSGIT
ncbi:unnamed protein product [Protopolystoma xenopodis]|uniref:Uncharacterized protein n=1 Tax=Protopolystoma xenopodis TaxID=117903 RepID=A0A448WX73_9PLAT|nr:unnamed protein product [Protopolystoma xenopodis]